MNRQYFFYFVFFILIIPFVIAAGTTIEATLDKNRVDLYHGQSETISGTVKNKNTICDVFCEYWIDSESKKSLPAMSKGNSDSFLITVTAPLKGVGSKDYSVNVHCIEHDSFWCSSNDFADWSATITLNYDLSPEEKSAKALLEKNLPIVELSLSSVDTVLNRVESRIDNLENNIKISDIKSNFNNIKNKFNSYNDDYENVLEDYNDENYLSAKGNLKSSLNSDINGLLNEISSVDNDINNRIHEHNQIANKIENVVQDFENFPKKLAIFLKKDGEVRLTSKNLNKLVNEFNRGTFTSYSNLDGRLNDIDSDISDKKSSYQSQLGGIINEGIRLINSEYDKLCKNKKSCSYDRSINIGSTKDLGDMDLICHKINNDLKQEFIQRNKELWAEYEDKIR